MKFLLPPPMSLANGGSHGWIGLAALGSGGGISAAAGLTSWGGVGFAGRINPMTPIGGGPGIGGGMGAVVGTIGTDAAVTWAAMRSLKSSGAGATGTSSGLRVVERSWLRALRRRVEPLTFCFPLDLERFGIFLLCSQLLGL